ncbi:DUF1566 domain-containing protein [Glaciecola sp. XM2]|uniref:Lcl C-terminal domain-containing protein n=1 Tax=Glaciecola sp. XM2 TaxID=1914931 RepID=UPI001BDF63B4|nr:DUF1566 domain-containing protein [Glaciecola sp. XM2]MBT1452421.1 DUF1566 domain-containing protein [Glaciecola sp. XM2]
MLIRISFTLLMITCLSACGGGDSASEPRLPTEPVLVTAGASITVNELEQASLTGAASGGSGVYTFSWSAPDGIAIEQGSSSSPDATLTAPVTTESVSFEVTLIATDEDGKQGRDTFILTVLPINALPVASIAVSQVDDYPALSFPVNTQVVLDGSASFDSDPQTADADIAAYMWQQVAGQDVLSGVDTTLSVLTFTTPVTLETSDIELMLTVTDQEGGESIARASITLLGEQGTQPDAIAGMPMTVFSGEQIALMGSAQSLAPNASPYTAQWRHSYTDTLMINNVAVFETFAQAPLVMTPTVITFELGIIDRFDNQDVDTVDVLVLPQALTTVNDTGVTLSATSENVSAEYQTSYPGQDAQYGLDRINASGVIDKTGRGDVGFDFTRLNSNGDPVDDESLSFSCIRDNITGLVWEVKTQDDVNALHYTEQFFTWFQEEENGNFAGSRNEASQSCNLDSEQCNTTEFVDTVNQVGLCGFFDWRIPTHYEMQSILHYGKLQGPLIDTDNFINPGTPVDGQLWYWTRQSSADGVSSDVARNAWAIDFASGVDNFLNKSGEYRLRLVRAGRRQQQ